MPMYEEETAQLEDIAARLKNLTDCL